jgi:hypothetical protein
MNDLSDMKDCAAIYKNRTGFLIISLIITYSLATAQLPDGVTVTQSFLSEIIRNYNDENSFPFDPNAISSNARIPILVHIVMNIKGSAGVNQNNIISSVNLANNYFQNAGMQFFIDSIDYINDYNYSYITGNNLKKELFTRYAADSRINLFLVDSIKMGAFRSYGFTYFPDAADSNLIFLDKDYSGGNALTTMLGHFMGLLSTHEFNGGREPANGNNCASGGDFICDTYADPDLFNLVIDSCQYTGTGRDNNGEYFVPSVANVMSNSPDNCKCIFTPLQYRRIYYYFKKYRQYLNH